MSAPLTSRRLAPRECRDCWDPFVIDVGGSVFCTSTWLDAVAPGAYEVCIALLGDRVVAGMPYVHTRIGPLSALRMPLLTPRLGVLLAPQGGDACLYRRSTNEMKWLETLVAGLPRAHYASLTFQPDFSNWLAFCWAGYKQTTRYTYMFKDLSDIDATFEGFARSKRKNIRRASQLVKVEQGLGAEALFLHHQASLGANGHSIRYSLPLLKRVESAMKPSGGWNTWYAVGSRGEILAAVLTITDSYAATFLISSLAPKAKETGCLSLLIWEAIKDAARKGLVFDFEGSMDRQIEESFRRFGAERIAYHHLCRGAGWQRLWRAATAPGRWVLKARGGFSDGYGQTEEVS